MPSSAALDLSFGGAKDTALPSERFQLEWIVTNDGSTTESNLSVSIPWPSGIASIGDGASLEGASCPSTTCDVGETAVWTVGTLEPGESQTVFFAPVVANSTPDSVIAWTASLTQGGTVVEDVQWTLDVAGDAFAQLSVDSDESLVMPGDDVRYRITFGNSGVSPLNNSDLAVDVPAGLTVLSAPGAVISGNQISWPLGNVPSGSVGRRYITLRVPASAVPGDVIEIDEVDFSGTYQGLPQETSARHVVSVGDSPLSFSLKAQQGVVSAGERFQMELVVTNRGVVVQQDVTVTMQYPAGISSIGEGSTDGGSCPSTTCDSGEHMSWVFGNLLSGESKSVRFAPVQASSATEGVPARWQARVASSAEAPRREYSTLGIATLAPTLVVESSHPKAEAGETFTYIVNYGNDGSAPLTNASLVFPLPEDVVLVEAEDASVSGRVVTWDVGDVGAGVVLRKYLTVRIRNSVADGQLISTDGVEFSGIFFGVEQATNAEQTVVVGEQDLQLAIRSHPGVSRPGESLQMEVVVSNAGSIVQQGVQVNLAYPTRIRSIGDGAFLEGAVCPSTTCDPGEQAVWSIGNLLPGETRSFTFAPLVANDAQVGNSAFFQGVVRNGSGVERRAESTVAITESAPTLAIWSDVHLVEASDVYTLFVAIGNRGFAELPQSFLSLVLPEELEFMSAPHASFSNGRLTWQIDQIIAGNGAFFDGGVGVLEVNVRARSSLTPGEQIVIVNSELSGSNFWGN